jgi:type IX secretion system substrate protein/phospholipase D-like protein
MKKTIANSAQNKTEPSVKQMNKRNNLFLALLFTLVTISISINGQNPKIIVYFNHPVNTGVSLGTNAIANYAFEDTIAAYINRAKYTVDIAQYDYTSSSSDANHVIATACNNAYVNRGVQVRWIYNQDPSSTPNSGLSLLNSSIPIVGSPTVGMASGYIMHNKFMIIDCNSSNPNDAVISTSSYDWSDAMTTGDYNNMVFIQDSSLASTYWKQFNQMWGSSGPTPVPANERFSTSKAASTQTSFTVNGTPIDVYFSPQDGAATQLQNVASSANYELYFGIYDFTLTNVSSAMQTRYSAGATGFGIMDQYAEGTTPYTSLTSSMGSNLKTYTGSYIYHNKIICVDANHPSSDPQVGCGSFNWTSTASFTSDENFMVIHDATVANEYYQSLCADFASLGGAACVSYLGIEKYDFGSQQVAVYPNPFVDVVNINVKNAGATLSVKITDQLGRVVFENTTNQTNEMQISAGALNTGVYFATVTSGNNTYTQKIIK